MIVRAFVAPKQVVPFPLEKIFDMLAFEVNKIGFFALEMVFLERAKVQRSIQA